MPFTFRIDDADATGAREGSLFWQNDPRANSSWTNPSVWDKKVVIYEVYYLADFFQKKLMERHWSKNCVMNMELPLLVVKHI